MVAGQPSSLLSLAVATWGYTKEEALESIREAAQAYLEVLVEEGRPLPKEAEGKVTISPSPAIAVSL